MRAPLDTIGRISSYLAGELTAAQRTAFESELQNDPALQQQLAFQQQLVRAVQRDALRKQIKVAAKQSGGNGFSWKALLIAGLIGLSALAGYIAFRTEPETKAKATTIATKNTPERPTTAAVSPAIATPATPIVINRGETTTQDRFPDNNAEWQPWVPFQRQYFSFNADAGSTIEGQNGTLIIVPANAFVDAAGNPVSGTVDLELIEAIDLADMIAYNLTTTSGGKALSSGGMLHIEARSGGQEVAISSERPLYVEIPTNDYNPDMKSWKGEVTGNSLDWTDPKPLKKFLTIVDFSQLDFTPEGFADEVEAQLPFRSYQKATKRLVDSLYYALGKTTDGTDVETEAPMVTAASDIPANGFIQSKGAANGVVRINDPQGAPLANVKVSYWAWNRTVESVTDAKGQFYVPQGEYDFTFYKPGFEDARFYKVIVNSDKISFLEVNLTPKKAEESCYIDPLSVKAIRTEQFNGTFIATKEFEERIQLLHKLKTGQAMLDLYISNLAMDLSAVDAMVAERLTGDDKVTFQRLSDQQLTNVKEAPLYDNQLSSYYNARRKEFAEENAAAREAYLKKDLKELEALRRELNKLNDQELTARFGNRKNSKTDVGNNNPIPLPQPSVANQQSYATPWYETGWMNIDCYLHALDQGVPVLVDIDAGTGSGSGSRQIYQCIDISRTVIGLTETNGIATAKFPNRSLPDSKKMEFTFAVSIEKQGDRIRYAEQRYNPYETGRVQLVQPELLSPDEFYQRLRKLSPIGSEWAKRIQDAEKRIKNIERIQQHRGRIQTQMQQILDRQKREAAMMKRLLGFINRCDEEESGNPITPESGPQQPSSEPVINSPAPKIQFKTKSN